MSLRLQAAQVAWLNTKLTLDFIAASRTWIDEDLISALLTALMVFVFEPGLFAQWSLFAVFSIITTWFWFRLNKQDKPVAEVKVLNQRTQRCVGAHTTLLEDVKLGRSRVRIEDTVWVAQTNEALKAGDEVKVVAAEGTSLLVKSIHKSSGTD